MKAIPKYTEEELVSLLKEQDADAFNYLFDHYSGALNSIARSFVQDEELANSILHDSFIKIWKQAGSFNRFKGGLFTWMSSIVRNTAIDALRSKDWKNNSRNVALTENSNDLPGGDSVKIESIGLRKFVGNLREEYRQVIELSYFDGMTHDEIAKNIGIPLGTVKTRIRNALIELRSRISTK